MLIQLIIKNTYIKSHKPTCTNANVHVLYCLTLNALEDLFKELQNMLNKKIWHKEQTSNKEIHLMFQIEKSCGMSTNEKLMTHAFPDLYQTSKV